MKKNYSTYVAMPRYPNFYQNPESKKIKFKKNFNGTPVIIFCKTTSIQAAKDHVDAELIKLFSSNPAQETRKRKGILNPSCGDAWLELMDEKQSHQIGDGTNETYKTSWKIGIGPFWETLTTKEVNHLTVTKYEHWYLKYHSERNFFNTRKHLGMLFNFMLKQGYIDKAPEIRDLDEMISKNTKKKEVGRVYTDEEIKLLLNHAFDSRTYFGILCYRYMGMRKNELLTAERVNWNFDKASARIWSSKNSKWREVPIPDIVVMAAATFLGTQKESRFLFHAPYDADKHLSSQVFDKSWTKTKVAAGIRDATVKDAARIHDLRHTFATQTATEGWPIMVACKVLDMSPEQYTKTYVHISKDDIELKMNRMATVTL